MLFGSKASKCEDWAKHNKIDKLIEALSDKDPAVKLAAVKALGAIKNDDAVNNLISQLRSPNPEMRKAILDALSAIGDKRASEFIRHLSNSDNDESVRQKALEVLRKLSA